MDEELLRWEIDADVLAARPCVNEAHLLQLCCWAMDGTMKQRRLAALLLHELHEVATIREEDIHNHVHFAPFVVACDAFLANGDVFAEDIMNRLRVDSTHYHANFAAAMENMYGDYPYCGKAVAEDMRNLDTAAHLGHFARLVSALARKPLQGHSDPLQKFKALTKLGKAHRAKTRHRVHPCRADATDYTAIGRSGVTDGAPTADGEDRMCKCVKKLARMSRK